MVKKQKFLYHCDLAKMKIFHLTDLASWFCKFQVFIKVKIW